MKKCLSRCFLLMLIIIVLGGTFLTSFAADKVEIELFYYKQEIVKQMGEMAAAFSKKYPNVAVKLTLIPNDSMTVLQTRMAGGDAPDIIQLQAYSAVFEFAQAGWLADLTNEPVSAKVVDGTKTSVTYNGRMYALPMDLAGIGIIYNKDIFNKYNLKTPTTFAELQEVCFVLKKNNITPFSGLFKANWSLGHFISMVHTTLTGPKLMPWLDSMNSGAGSFADPINNRDLFRILDFYKANVGENAAEMDWDEQQAAFASGEAAMMVQGLWSYGAAIETNPKLNCGFIPFPCTNNAEDAKLFADVDSTFALSAISSPAKTKAAKEFLNWLSTPEAIKIWVERCKLVPTFKGADVSTMDAPFQDLVRYMNEGKTNPWAFAMYPVAAFEDACKNGAQEYIFGLKNANDVIQFIDDTWRRERQK